MDNEELKKKIIDVLRDNREYELRYYHHNSYTEVVIDYEAIADALIAAGLKFDRNISYTAIFNHAQCERINDLERRLAATDYRAGVAERALLFLCDKIMSDISVIVFPSTKIQVLNKQELYDYCIEQAEREIEEEERKDD